MTKRDLPGAINSGRPGPKPGQAAKQRAIELIAKNIYELTVIQIEEAYKKRDVGLIERLQNRVWGYPKMEVASEVGVTVKWEAEQLQGMIMGVKGLMEREKVEFIEGHRAPYMIGERCEDAGKDKES